MKKEITIAVAIFWLAGAWTVPSLAADEEAGVPNEEKVSVGDMTPTAVLPSPLSGPETPPPEPGEPSAPVSGQQPAAAETPNPSPAASVPFEIHFEDIGIRQALDRLIWKGGLTIDADENIEGRVNLSLLGVEPMDVLRIILDANHLAWVQENGVIRVMTPAVFADEYGHSFQRQVKSRIIHLTHASPFDVKLRLESMKSPQGKIIIPLDPQEIILMDTSAKLDAMAETVSRMDVAVVTEVISLRYAPPAEVLDKINPLLTEGIGQARLDERSRKIVVTDARDNVTKIEEMVREWDAPREVRIRAEAVRVALADEFRDGIDWEAIVADYQCVTGDSTACPQGEKGISIGTISREDYDVLMEALDAVGDMRVMGGPEIRSLAAHKTYLQVSPVGKDVLVTMVNPASEAKNPPEGGAAGTEAASEASFYLTPVVHLDDSLSLCVSRKDAPSGDGQQTTEGTAPVCPGIMLDIKKNTVVVIGGMFKEEKVRVTKKVPLLGDLPILGWAFQRHRINNQRIEHVVFLRLDVLPVTARSP